MPGPDHKASLEPKELKNYIENIHETNTILGNGIKAPSETEAKNIEIVRKSIVAKTVINIGDKFNSNNITTKRPGNGISPMEIEMVLGKTAKKKFEVDDLIEIK